MEEKLIEGLALSELWKAMSVMGTAQLFGAVFIVSIFFTALLLIVFRKSVSKWINKKQEKNYSDYRWPTEEMINIQKLPDKLSLMKDEADLFKKMILHKIEFLRNEKVSGKQFIINMENTVYMSKAIRTMFTELADNSIKLNIVRLIYVIPNPKKPKNKTDMDKFYLEIKSLCKKHNKPGSWAVKYGLKKKKFYEI